MVLLYSLVAITSLASLALSQNASTTTVDIQTIPLDTKKQWCTSQTSSCPLICLQLPGTSDKPASNECNDKTLVYSCICSNNQSPNASEYSQTIPYFLCTEENNQCVNACSQGDSACQDECRTSNPCGAQNPKLSNTTDSNATATSTATSTTSSLAPFTGVPEDGALVLKGDIMQVYGLVVVLGGFFVGFVGLL
ncbi:hypothetical protein BDV18DRAFT_145907 [Aspergillus unguis]